MKPKTDNRSTFWPDTLKTAEAVRHRVERAYELLDQAEQEAQNIPYGLTGRFDVLRCLGEAKRWTAGVNENLPEEST